MWDFSGRRVVVTGAGSAIGTHAFLRRQFQVGKYCHVRIWMYHCLVHFKTRLLLSIKVRARACLLTALLVRGMRL